MEHLSQHAATRMQQRGIPPAALECLLEYGRLQYDHCGAAIVFLDKAARRRLARDLKNRSLPHASGGEIGTIPSLAEGGGGLGVDMQEVVSAKPKSLHGRYTANSMVRAVPVVMMDPTLKHGRTLHGMVVGKAIGPFPECRLDESLGFPVGAGRIRFGEDVLQAQAPTGAFKDLGTERPAVVGHYTTHLDSQGPKVTDRVFQELHCTGRCFVGVELGETYAGMIVDTHEQKFPTGAPSPYRLIACDAVAHDPNATQLLGIDVQ
jgi:hypothetical protein